LPYCTYCGAQFADGPCPNCLHPTVGRTLEFTCDAEGTTLLGLYLKNLLLSIITLGIYSFWGRTEIRRYLYGTLLAGEDRFAWHGTGREMLLGWLKAAGFLVVFYIIFFLLVMADKTAGPIIGALFLYGVILAITPWVMVAVQRYRLSRTSLRGIHFSTRAKTGELAKIYFKGLGLTLVTLGLYSPWFANDLHGYFVRNTYYGDQTFEYDGDGQHLFGSWMLFLLLLLPTLYFITFWYVAKQHRYFTGHTTWRAARFQSVLRGRSILGLMVTNLLLIVFTLGLGLPWARIRTIRLACRTTTLENFEGFDTVGQRTALATATGENMSGMLEMDADVGGGLGL
jgi:uncharacterized membrane protein YjgN (DUF898 family)